jgi:hypothetical protein
MMRRDSASHAGRSLPNDFHRFDEQLVDGMLRYAYKIRPRGLGCRPYCWAGTEQQDYRTLRLAVRPSRAAVWHWMDWPMSKPRDNQDPRARQSEPGDSAGHYSEPEQVLSMSIGSFPLGSDVGTANCRIYAPWRLG